MTQAVLIDGKLIAALKRQNIKQHVSQTFHAFGRKPSLHVILVGDHPASQLYVQNKQAACHEVGIDSCVHKLSENMVEDGVLDLIKGLNQDPGVHGILLQLPLPNAFNRQRLLNEINPAKDVDGLHPYNLGRLISGDPLMVPCTPLGCLELIQSVCPDLRGKHALVVGRSILVGKPMAMLLTNNDVTVTLAHSSTVNLKQLCQQADILVTAIGQPRFITADFIKPGAIVIDVGINRDGSTEEKASVVGDVDRESVQKVAGYVTPVPGGVGPMTIACLLSNTVRAMTVQIADAI
ncbi:bifunctional methylenetetrahydrofolate dehydrogenase/methenyltetrahydrofolate cyclohydrolase FolD [Candidatus Finniella inopinata]|uniref:Bifunctional protein FolD n=1 Tax=Candidatus Finniella inopinata TaxID=1696036 RepID=A0A4Q7DJM9_9PROT|nr:bifunctional methylenetetrahydrofolate dehydrogenase/methenyltetrahydrofolate cyclohydrolase FolD [Candidatus Finniella inopinata]RZI46952.1 bifunctional methylenetetrahydrofolate dehydrogenase/methenyltetrahydrofolate cyclohydrolase FolD [Candidatus Finniella inopinata]